MLGGLKGLAGTLVGGLQGLLGGILGGGKGGIMKYLLKAGGIKMLTSTIWEGIGKSSIGKFMTEVGLGQLLKKSAATALAGSGLLGSIVAGLFVAIAGLVGYGLGTLINNYIVEPLIGKIKSKGAPAVTEQNVSIGELQAGVAAKYKNLGSKKERMYDI